MTIEVEAESRGLISPEPFETEKRSEQSLRPETLDEMIGQTRLRENLSVFVRAAREREEALDHLLFYGPPGLGKTSLARIVANEMGAQFRATSGPAIERPGDLAALLSNLESGDVLFIDEIHRLTATVEEILYPAMEDFQLDILIGEGPSARSIRLDLPRFTLIGATARAGLLTSPLRDRVGEQILSSEFTLTDDGLLPGGLSSSAFDDEGVPRRTRVLIEAGVLRGFVHDLETARATGSEPTGNGERGGVTGKPGPGFSNLLLSPGTKSVAEMMAGIKYGLLVHSVIGMGQGNTLPGNFSNPVDLAYLIEDGEVKGRVKDVSIAGNIYELLMDQLGGLSSEVKVLSGTVHLPWMLIDDMKVVGKGS